MTVSELVALLALVPQDAEVLVDFENGHTEPAAGVAIHNGGVVIAHEVWNYPHLVHVDADDAGVSR